MLHAVARHLLDTTGLRQYVACNVPVGAGSTNAVPGAFVDARAQAIFRPTIARESTRVASKFLRVAYKLIYTL